MKNFQIEKLNIAEVMGDHELFQLLTENDFLPSKRGDGTFVSGACLSTALEKHVEEMGGIILPRGGVILPGVSHETMKMVSGLLKKEKEKKQQQQIQGGFDKMHAAMELAAQKAMEMAKEVGISINIAVEVNGYYTSCYKLGIYSCKPTQDYHYEIKKALEAWEEKCQEHISTKDFFNSLKTVRVWRHNPYNPEIMKVEELFPDQAIKLDREKSLVSPAGVNLREISFKEFMRLSGVSDTLIETLREGETGQVIKEAVIQPAEVECKSHYQPFSGTTNLGGRPVNIYQGWKHRIWWSEEVIEREILIGGVILKVHLKGRPMVIPVNYQEDNSEDYCYKSDNENPNVEFIRSISTRKGGKFTEWELITTEGDGELLKKIEESQKLWDSLQNAKEEETL